MLSIQQTPDTAKFTGELLVNDANINSEDYKENAKQLFRYLYPVRILDRFPQIAFPSFKAFGWGILFGGFIISVAAVTATLIHPYLGLGIELILGITIALFGLRRWFRVGEVIGMVSLGIMIPSYLEEQTGLAFIKNSNQLLTLFDDTDNKDWNQLLFILVVFGLAFLTTKLLLVKSTTKNSWSLIAFENNQIDKFLQLWVIACAGIGVPDAYLLKFMGKRKLKQLREVGAD